MNILISIIKTQFLNGMTKRQFPISKKHGIRFETASKVFADDNKLIRYDEEHPKEDRYDILGKVGKVLFVVCTFKKGNIIHIISARRATEPEKVRYEYGESYDA